MSASGWTHEGVRGECRQWLLKCQLWKPKSGGKNWWESSGTLPCLLHIVKSRLCPMPDPEPPGPSVLLHKVIEKLISLPWWFTILISPLITEEGRHHAHHSTDHGADLEVDNCTTRALGMILTKYDLIIILTIAWSGHCLKQGQNNIHRMTRTVIVIWAQHSQETVYHADHVTTKNDRWRPQYLPQCWF